MRFNNYINEDQKDKHMQLSEKILDYIQNNCKKYIKEYIRNGKLLWSGRKKKEPYYNIKKIRKDRRPTDTPIRIHNLLDDYFEKHFGVRLRSNSLFCYTNMYDVLKYGEPYLICPVGDYETYYHPKVHDLYVQMKQLVLKNIEIDDFDMKSYDVNVIIYDKHPKFIDRFEKNVEKLVEGYKKGVERGTYMKGQSPEIMLHGDKYMIIGQRMLIDYNEYLIDKIESL